jgi:hypothetical protein
VKAIAMKEIINIANEFNEFIIYVSDKIDSNKEKELKGRISDIKVYDFDKKDDPIIKLEKYHMYKTVIELFDHIKDYFSDMETRYTVDVSKTFQVDTSNKYTEIVKKYLQIRKKIQDKSDKMLAEFDTTSIDEELFIKIKEFVKTHKYAIDFYIEMFRNKNIRDKYDYELELDKNYFLGIAPHKKQYYISNINVPNMGTVKLSKTGISGDLISVLSSVVNVAKKDISEISKLNSCQIIILHAISSQKVIYKADKLLGQSVPKIIDSTNVHLSRTIEIEETSKQEKKKDKNKYEFKTEIINAVKDECKFTILLKYDGNEYTLMQSFDGRTKLNKKDVMHLLLFDEKNITRIQKIHTIYEKSIMDNVFLMTSMNIDLFEKEVETIDYKDLRVVLMTEIIKHSENTLGKLITSSKFDEQMIEDCLSKLVHFDYENVVLSNTIKEFKKEIDKMGVNLHSSFKDIIAIFITQLKFIIKLFSREMHNNYMLDIYEFNKERRNKDVMTKDVIMKTVAQMFEKILDKSLRACINEDTNIYKEPYLKIKKMLVKYKGGCCDCEIGDDCE